MPQQAQHFAQARRNLNLYEAFQLLEQAYPEWLVTIGFYALVHYSEGLLASFNRHPGSHGQREADLVWVFQNHAQHAWLRSIFPNLQRIRTLAQDARYGRPGVGIFDWKTHRGFEEFLATFNECRTAFSQNLPTS